MDPNATVTVDPNATPAPDAGLPRDPATGQFVSSTPDPNATPAVEPVTPPVTPAVEPAKPPDVADMTPEEIANMKSKLAYYQTGYQAYTAASSPEMRDKIKADLSKRYGPQTTTVDTTDGVVTDDDIFSPQNIGKIVDQRLNAHDQAKQLDAMTDQLQQEYEQVSAGFDKWCADSGLPVESVQRAVASPSVRRIDTLIPGGWQTRAHVASLILSNEALQTANTRLVAIVEKLTAQVKGKVAGVSEPPAGAVPTGATMFTKPGGKTLADNIFPGDRPVE